MTINTNSTEIKKQIAKIQKYINEDENLLALREQNKLEFMTKMFETFSDFSKKYPTLLKLIIFEKDLSPLDNFFKSIDNINKGNVDRTSEETKLGYFLAEKYFPSKLKDQLPNKFKK